MNIIETRGRFGPLPYVLGAVMGVSLGGTVKVNCSLVWVSMFLGASNIKPPMLIFCVVPSNSMGGINPSVFTLMSLVNSTRSYFRLSIVTFLLSSAPRNPFISVRANDRVVSVSVELFQ